MSVTRNMLVKIAISHLARYSFLVSSDVCTEDDNDGSEVFESYDISLPDTLHTFLSQYLSALFALSSRQNSSWKKKRELRRTSARTRACYEHATWNSRAGWIFIQTSGSDGVTTLVASIQFLRKILSNISWSAPIENDQTRFDVAVKRRMYSVENPSGMLEKREGLIRGISTGASNQLFANRLSNFIDLRDSRESRVQHRYCTLYSVGSHRASPRVSHEVQWKDRRERAVTWQKFVESCMNYACIEIFFSVFFERIWHI